MTRLPSKKSFIDPSRAFYGEVKEDCPYRARTALDFWQWAYSDLIQNITRGIVAEYLVAWAAGVDDVRREPWESCDLVLSNGVKVEVKCTAYVQAWTYTNKIAPKFIIGPRKPYTLDKGLGKKAKFNADLYVLCYHKGEDHNQADPMNVAQWDFWVLTQREVRDELGGRQGITVKELQKRQAPIQFSQLGTLIQSRAKLTGRYRKRRHD